MKELSPNEKIEAAESFKKHLFWKAAVKPITQAIIAGLTVKLRNCPLKEVQQTRARIDAFEKLLQMPDDIKDAAKSEILIHQYINPEDFEDEQSG